MIEATQSFNLGRIRRSVRTRTDLFRVTDDRTEGIDQEVSNRRGKMSQIPEPIFVVGLRRSEWFPIHSRKSLTLAD